MTNSIGEIVGNDVLFIIGSNATEAHPIIGNKMKQAHLRGAKLIVVDPRRTELAEHAHLWLQLRPGTDNALVNGMLHTIISNGWHDKEYIETRTEGFDALWETVKDYPAERRVGDLRRAGRDHRRGGASCTRRRPRPASSTRWASPSTPSARPT